MNSTPISRQEPHRVSAGDVPSSRVPDPTLAAAIPQRIGPAGVALYRDHAPLTVPQSAPSAGRGDELFREHPISGEYVLKSGVVVPTPFHCYDGDATFVMGTADLATAQRLMGDKSGDLQVTVDGSRALISILVASYRDTSLGSYRELVLASFVSKEPHDLSSKNICALTVPLFDPTSRVHVQQLALNREAQVPIDYGREILGLDKIPSQAVVKRDGAKLRFAFDSTSGAAGILGGQMTDDPSLWTRIKMGFGVLRAIGLRKALKFAWTRTLAWSVVSVDPNGTGLKTGASFIKGVPTINRWTAADKLDFGDEAIGKTLRDLDFLPMLKARYPHAKVALEAR